MSLQKRKLQLLQAVKQSCSAGWTGGDADPRASPIILSPVMAAVCLGSSTFTEHRAEKLDVGRQQIYI